MTFKQILKTAVMVHVCMSVTEMTVILCGNDVVIQVIVS